MMSMNDKLFQLKWNEIPVEASQIGVKLNQIDVISETLYAML